MGIALLWIASVAIGTYIGHLKGAAQTGFSLGLFLGPLGLVLACLMPMGPHTTWRGTLTGVEPDALPPADD
jgi:hypothetical protein